MLGSSATCLLGNHDLHLLAVAAGARPQAAPARHADAILAAPPRPGWTGCARAAWPTRPRAGCWCTPAWCRSGRGRRTLALAAEVQAAAARPRLARLPAGDVRQQARRWDDAWKGADRWRIVINVLTRIRFCQARRHAGLRHQGRRRHRAARLPALVRGPAAAPGQPIAFGHWSTLGLIDRPTCCRWTPAASGAAPDAVRVDGGRRESCRCAAKASASDPGPDVPRMPP
jgi:bis(5'-nucleosyl)-tetraphosphatase (symmetrical)